MEPSSSAFTTCSRRRLWILRAQVVGVTPARSFILALELLYFATLDWLSIGNSELFVEKIRKSAFDPKIVFAKVGEYRNIRRIGLFCHGVMLRTFYAQKDKIKLPIVSERGKEAVVRILEPMHFFGEGRRNGRPLRVTTA
jgi:hypothetical protein